MHIQKTKQSFSKISITPSDKPYCDIITKRTEQENIIIFSDSIPTRIKMNNFNKVLKNGKANHLPLKQLFQNVLDGKVTTR